MKLSRGIHSYIGEMLYFMRINAHRLRNSDSMEIVCDGANFVIWKLKRELMCEKEFWAFTIVIIVPPVRRHFIQSVVMIYAILQSSLTHSLTLYPFQPNMSFRSCVLYSWVKEKCIFTMEKVAVHCELLPLFFSKLY